MQPLLVYSPEFTAHASGDISFVGNNLVHHIGGQELIDPDWTVAQLEYPYPVLGRFTSPEQPARATACYESLLGFGLIGNKPNQFRLVAPSPADDELLSSVHDAAYIRQVEALSQAGGAGWGNHLH